MNKPAAVGITALFLREKHKDRVLCTKNLFKDFFVARVEKTAIPFSNFFLKSFINKKKKA